MDGGSVRERLARLTVMETSVARLIETCTIATDALGEIAASGPGSTRFCAERALVNMEKALRNNREVDA